ncbi:unnamed protein product [Vitrella brassicaformis CCMP3155]|uniref:Uncharacterized protein n=1 Tax=Vitrella brassicaformis (strain CCMP3155) TaxID=1169540 RepID=A0A0G4GZX6_VITBC|nr:unnamed protein product [Vitrella brassicaformis CCMP3155]|eukprot:CEM36840.1 unnamed protein product [Vitrella brassicaformis CCMP3155]
MGHDQGAPEMVDWLCGQLGVEGSTRLFRGYIRRHSTELGSRYLRRRGALNAFNAICGWSSISKTRAFSQWTFWNRKAAACARVQPADRCASCRRMVRSRDGLRGQGGALLGKSVVSVQSSSSSSAYHYNNRHFRSRDLHQRGASGATTVAGGTEGAQVASLLASLQVNQHALTDLWRPSAHDQAGDLEGVEINREAYSHRIDTLHTGELRGHKGHFVKVLLRCREIDGEIKDISRVMASESIFLHGPCKSSAVSWLAGPLGGQPSARVHAYPLSAIFDKAALSSVILCVEVRVNAEKKPRDLSCERVALPTSRVGFMGASEGDGSWDGTDGVGEVAGGPPHHDNGVGEGEASLYYQIESYEDFDDMLAGAGFRYVNNAGEGGNGSVFRVANTWLRNRYRALKALPREIFCQVETTFGLFGRFVDVSVTDDACIVKKVPHIEGKMQTAFVQATAKEVPPVVSELLEANKDSLKKITLHINYCSRTSDAGPIVFSKVTHVDVRSPAGRDYISARRWMFPAITTLRVGCIISMDAASLVRLLRESPKIERLQADCIELDDDQWANFLGALGRCPNLTHVAGIEINIRCQFERLYQLRGTLSQHWSRADEKGTGRQGGE